MRLVSETDSLLFHFRAVYDQNSLGQMKKIISFSSGSVKKKRREGRFIFYFCDFFIFHSGWPLTHL